MAKYLKSVLDTLLDMSPQEIVGAVMIALTLSLVMTGIYALLRKKAAEPLTLMACLMLLACVSSMAFAAGYVRRPLLARRSDGPAAFPVTRPVPRVSPTAFLAQRLIVSADTNKDGRLTQEEAAVAVADFMRVADADGKGSVSFPDLDRALWNHLGMPIPMGDTVPPLFAQPSDKFMPLMPGERPKGGTQPSAENAGGRLTPEAVP